MTVPEARIIQIAPWEKSLLKEIEKAIQTSDLGINPQNDCAKSFFFEKRAIAVAPLSVSVKGPLEKGGLFFYPGPLIYTSGGGGGGHHGTFEKVPAGGHRPDGAGPGQDGVF